MSGCSTTMSNDSLIVGIECAYAPFNWIDKTSNSYNMPISNHSGQYADGFDVQIAKQLGQELGKEVTIVQTPWESLIADLQTGNINCIISGMTDTNERELSIDFSDEYYRSELVLIVKKSIADAHPTALSATEFGDLVNGQIIVSQKSTATDDMIDIFSTTYGAIHATPVSTFPLAAQDVKNGSAFAMTAELPVANSITSSISELGIIHIDQSILGEDQYQLGVSVGLKKGNSELQSQINSVIDGWSESWKLSTMEAALSRASALEE